jgi:2-phosphosulfolactate phosphatase
MLHLRNLLEGRVGDPEAVRRLILAGGEIARLNDPARPHLHLQDLDIALDIDRHDLSIRVQTDPARLVAAMERPD